MAPPAGLRFRFRITRTGFIYVVLTLSFGVQGALAGNNLVFLLFAVMSGFALGLAVLTAWMPSAVGARHLLPEAVSAGETFEYVLEIWNLRKTRSVSCLEVIDHRLTAEPLSEPARIEPITPGGSVTLTRTVTTASRGWLVFDELIIRCQFPFGLFVAERRLAIEDRILVFPERWVFQSRFRLNALGGNLATAELPGRSNSDIADFSGLRDYHPGDHPRHIHWHASGRFPDQILARQYEPQHGRRVIVLLDSFYARSEESRCRPVFEENICLALALLEKFLSEQYEVILVGYSGGPRIFYLRPISPELEDVRRWLALLQPDHQYTWYQFTNGLKLPTKASRVELRLPGDSPSPALPPASHRPLRAEDLKPFAAPRRMVMAQTHSSIATRL